MILGSETVTRRRFAAGSRGSDGRWTDGASTDTSIAMSVQPMTDRDLRSLPEGERSLEQLKGYTEADVRTLSQQDGAAADHIQVRGSWFEVRQVEEQRMVIPHKKVRLVRLQEAEA